MKDVQAGHEVFEVVDLAQGESLEKRAFEFERPQRVRGGGASVRQLHGAVRESRGDGRHLSGFDDAYRTPGTQIDGDQRVGAGGQPQRRT